MRVTMGQMYVRGVLVLIGIVFVVYFIVAASRFDVHQGGGPMAAGGAPAVTVDIDDAQTGVGTNGLFYRGTWEHIRHRYDGRNDGTSSRSRTAGDAVSFVFRGRTLWLYGVTGPKGGPAIVRLDDVSYPVNFYSPHIHTHALVYEARDLSPGLHAFTLTVQRPAVRGRAFVNLDDVQIETVRDGG